MTMQRRKRITVGLIEKITIYGTEKSKEIIARIDTGAVKSSIDSRLAEELGLGPVLRSAVIKSASGRSRRPVVQAEIEIAGRRIMSEFNIADRKHMRYSVLIGQDILKGNGFLVDAAKK